MSVYVKAILNMHVSLALLVNMKEHLLHYTR